MATSPKAPPLKLTRDQLASFLQDFEQIKQFENLFSIVQTIAPIVGQDFEFEAGNASAKANEALASLIALAQDTAVTNAAFEAKVQQALDAIPRLAQALELLSLEPKRELGTIASQNADNVNITGGLISGLDAPLPVASGGIGVTTAAANTVFAGPISGLSAPPAFRALIAADIPPLTSGTSILFGNGTGGFSNVTIGTGVSFAGGILSATGSGGTVTSVTGTSPVVSSGGTTPAISLAANYGDTQNPYASKTANFFLAAPNGAPGSPAFRAIVAADVPTLNQNTTGTAANVTGTVAIINGGTGQTTQQAAINALAGAVTSGQYLRGNGTNVVLSAIQAADVPTLNQNTTGTASNVTGTVAIANGGTGATTAATARTNLGLGTIATQNANNVNITGGTVNATTLQQGGSQSYVRSNILGTVSESGGVPSGAIIERGSNANGEFVKYADGTMICTAIRSGTSGTFADFTWNYPSTFSTVLFATGNENGTGAGNNNGSGQYLSIRSTRQLPNSLSNMVFNLQSGYQTRLTSTAYNFTLLAIGRWF